MIITLDEAKAHLRYDGSDNDAEIRLMMAAAQSVIERHVDKRHLTDPPEAFKMAALLLIGFWDENRAAQNGGSRMMQNAESRDLPPPVLALLTPYRTPVAF